MTAPLPPAKPVSVRGGTGGIEAYTEELTALAGRLGGVGLELAGALAGLHLAAADPGFLESALLDPVGAARVEAALFAALDGPHGIAWIAARCGLLAAALRAAAIAYVTADTVETDVREVLAALGCLGPAMVGAVDSAIRAHDVSRLQMLLADDPELLEFVVRCLLPILRGLAAALPVLPAVVSATGGDVSGVAGTPPRTVTDLLAELAQRTTDGSGAIDVRILNFADGSRRVIVDITGMRTYDPLARHDTTGPLNAAQDMFGLPSTYEAGVLAAMRAAGVRSSDDVLLVGHSEGGMVAVNAARDAVASGQYRVTHVITAGSPIAITAGGLPSSVKVLAVENDGDAVPCLDGAPNPDRSNVTTVTVRHNHGSLRDDHDLRNSYLPGARDIDASTDGSVEDYLASAADYLAATSVQTKTYRVTQ
jgi:hypothetical protein